jgi:cytochrome bd-type quinol oxidase subunit 2
VRPGTVALLAVLLGSTAFDSFSAMPQWRGFVDAHTSSTVTATLVRTGGLAVFALAVAGTFWLAARATGGVDARARRELPGAMAHSLIPIVIGYVFAHYLTYLIERGQQTVIALFGLDADVNYVLSMHPPVLATIKVGCVVAGHVAGVIAAHDRALRLLPAGHQLTGQLAMMLVMVGYTFTGLYLLFGG